MTATRLLAVPLAPRKPPEVGQVDTRLSSRLSNCGASAR
jgi:hypothetical protein